MQKRPFHSRSTQIDSVNPIPSIGELFKRDLGNFGARVIGALGLSGLVRKPGVADTRGWLRKGTAVFASLAAGVVVAGPVVERSFVKEFDVSNSDKAVKHTKNSSQPASPLSRKARSVQETTAQKQHNSKVAKVLISDTDFQMNFLSSEIIAKAQGHENLTPDLRIYKSPQAGAPDGTIEYTVSRKQKDSSLWDSLVVHLRDGKLLPEARIVVGGETPHSADGNGQKVKGYIDLIRLDKGYKIEGTTANNEHSTLTITSDGEVHYSEGVKPLIIEEAAADLLTFPLMAYQIVNGTNSPGNSPNQSPSRDIA